MVVIPSSIKEIPEAAFAGCSGLLDSDRFVILRNMLVLYGGTESHVVIPDGVTHTCSNAFSSNMKLESVYIPDSMTHIGTGAFDGCRNLTAVRFPADPPEMDDNVFRNYIGLMGERGGILYKYTCSETVVVLPEDMANYLCQTLPVRQCKTTFPLPERTIFLLWFKETAEAPNIRLFLDTLREVLADYQV